MPTAQARIPACAKAHENRAIHATRTAAWMKTVRQGVGGGERRDDDSASAGARGSIKGGRVPDKGASLSGKRFARRHGVALSRRRRRVVFADIAPKCTATAGMR